jgi:hypothetical protein
MSNDTVNLASLVTETFFFRNNAGMHVLGNTILLDAQSHLAPQLVVLGSLPIVYLKNIFVILIHMAYNLVKTMVILGH